MVIERPINTPIRDALTWEERWQATDNGLIACWERGREMAIEQPDRAQLALIGHLIPLPWKGGIDPDSIKVENQEISANSNADSSGKSRKAPVRYGTYHYLAMWQGLRGENLKLDTDRIIKICCTGTGRLVRFTGDERKYCK